MLIFNMEGEEMYHSGFRKSCPACNYHCRKCGNRARESDGGEFLAYRDLYENGGYCNFRCKGADLENNGLCYHCGSEIDDDMAFCSMNCHAQFND